MRLKNKFMGLQHPSTDPTFLNFPFQQPRIVIQMRQIRKMHALRKTDHCEPIFQQISESVHSRFMETVVNIAPVSTRMPNR